MALTIDLDAGLRPPPSPERGTPDNSLVFCEEIGQGAEGIVYVALPRDHPAHYGAETLGKSGAVAVKVVTGRAYDRCCSTRALWQSLAHPNVVFPRDAWFDEQNRRCFVEMELLSTDLLNFVLREGALDDARASQLAGNLAAALKHLHGQGIAHRDVKLENVFLKNGVDKLGDLGSIAQIVRPATVLACPRQDFGGTDSTEIILSVEEQENSTPASASGSSASPSAASALVSEFVGSTLYAPPEFVRGNSRCGISARYPGSDADARQHPLLSGDMWSLGVTLYGAVAGCHPWEVASMAGSDDFRRFVRAGPASFFPDTFSSGLRSLLAKLLAIDPSERPTVDEVLAHEWVTAPAPTPPSGGSPKPGMTAACEPAPVTPTGTEDAFARGDASPGAFPAAAAAGDGARANASPIPIDRRRFDRRHDADKSPSRTPVTPPRPFAAFADLGVKVTLFDEEEDAGGLSPQLPALGSSPFGVVRMGVTSSKLARVAPSPLTLSGIESPGMGRQSGHGRESMLAVLEAEAEAQVQPTRKRFVREEIFEPVSGSGMGSISANGVTHGSVSRDGHGSMPRKRRRVKRPTPLRPRAAVSIVP